MINKTNGRYLYVIVILVVMGLTWLSYLNAKSIAGMLVGSSIEYAQLSRVTVGVVGEKKIVWIFRFSHPTIFDAEFDIYVSVLGEVILTNPTDLERRLRNMEKLEVHPYSERGIRERYGDKITKALD